MKRKYKPKAYRLALTCQYCERTFYSKRYKKYCSAICAAAANKALANMRYQEMKKALLKARGVIK